VPNGDGIGGWEAAIRLSVIIPTFNRVDVLRRTLPRLLAQDFPASDYELIYVLDGSTDGTAVMLRTEKTAGGLLVLEQPNRGPSAARNAGMQVARGELVLFLDDDILCPPHLFRLHSAAHPDLSDLVVHGPIYIAPESPPTLARYTAEAQYEGCYRHRDPAVGLPFPMNASSLVNSSMPRQMLLSAGGFDERTRSAEDLDLGLSLWKKGAGFRFLPEAETLELYVKTSREFLHGQKKTAFGELHVSRKHPEYRPYSGLAAIGRPAGWKRMARDAIVRVPVTPIPLLAPAIWLAERFSGPNPLRNAGTRLLRFAADVAFQRAANDCAGSWPALLQEFGVRLPVLMYHHVGPAKPGTYRELTVTPEKFERQMHWLKRRDYTGIRAVDWIHWLRTGKGLPAKPVLLTFDDGYADLAEHAFPVLRRHGFGAVVFAVTSLAGGTNAWDEAKGSATHRLLTAEQIRYWAAQGIEFGSHTRTHADLTTLSAAQLEDEVAGSRRELAGLIGSDVTSFAYPYGAYNAAVQAYAQEAYDVVFRADETTPGVNFLFTAPHDLQRTMVHPQDGLADLGCRLRLGYSPIQNFRARTRLRSRLKRAAYALAGRKVPEASNEFF